MINSRDKGPGCSGELWGWADGAIQDRKRVTPVIVLLLINP